MKDYTTKLTIRLVSLLLRAGLTVNCDGIMAQPQHVTRRLIIYIVTDEKADRHYYATPKQAAKEFYSLTSSIKWDGIPAAAYQSAKLFFDLTDHLLTLNSIQTSPFCGCFMKAKKAATRLRNSRQ